jgi:putative DNA primase/helicase
MIKAEDFNDPFPPRPVLLNSNETAAEVQNKREQLNRPKPNGHAAEDWPEPEDLGSELPPVPAFDPRLLPSALRPMVEDVADRMQVPIDFPAVVSVATLAGLCGRRAVIQPKEHDYSWLVVPNLWGGIVAEPGRKKSPVIACITKPAHAVEAQWRAEYESELAGAKASKVLTGLKNRAWEQQYIAALKKNAEIPIQPDDSVAEPRRKRLLTTDATFESLQKIMADNPAGIFVLRDELTGWLAGLERQGREQERAFYLECWNGDSPHTIDRIERGCVHVDHCCAVVFGSIQPARVRSYLADVLRDGPTNDGLIQRFQLLVWPDEKQDWRYRDRLPAASALRAADEVYRRIATMDPDNPLKLQFAPDAQALFVAWLTDLEARLRGDDVSVFMQAHLAKYGKLMPALALLFSLADEMLDHVGLAHAQQAADWCGYLEQHAHRLYASRISPERLAAMSLAKRLNKGWKREDGSFSLRDVYRNDWSGLGTPEEAEAALRLVEVAGWVRKIVEKPETGRPSLCFMINPKVGGSCVRD